MAKDSTCFEGTGGEDVLKGLNDARSVSPVDIVLDVRHGGGDSVSAH